VVVFSQSVGNAPFTKKSRIKILKVLIRRTCCRPGINWLSCSTTLISGFCRDVNENCGLLGSYDPIGCHHISRFPTLLCLAVSFVTGFLSYSES
jgi:hypothetical protein